MFLVLIETSGNQNYIFSTNKLRENIGASQLTYLAGTKWVIDAVAKVDGNSRLSLWTDRGSQQLRDRLLNRELNPPIEDEQTKFNIELVLAASGKAMLLVKDKAKAQAVIRQVTLQALKAAPGLEISGVIHEFDWHKKRSLETAIKAIHQKFEANRSQIPSPAMRFLRLPVVEECASSGLPAAMVEQGADRAISLTSQRKQSAKDSGFDRIATLLKEYPSTNFANSLQIFDRDLLEEAASERSIDWLGVIHADGNGLGKIFINFPKHLSKIKSDYTNRDYVDWLRDFSLALDICTEKAFMSALSVFQDSKPEQDMLPIFPLILGGDDLTVICNGQQALPFIKRFLIEFETATQQNETISSIAQVALKGDRLSACAGVAIVKPHFPFSVAYELAESLAKSAKKVKEIVVTKSANNNVEDIPYPCSAVDFHIVYDSSGVELQRIRQSLEKDSDREQTKLYRRPYVVTAPSDLTLATGEDWVREHHWSLLEHWIEVLRAKDESGKSLLPNSQIYKLREYLSLDREVVDSSYLLIQKRYKEQGITQLEGVKDSLFVLEPNENKEAKQVYMTGLLDAIEAADFF